MMVPFYSEHPRVCGENFEHPECFLEAGGTSPRMRGKRFRPVSRRSQGGNIPAYAGKTYNKKYRKRKRLEHPRVCGEN